MPLFSAMFIIPYGFTIKRRQTPEKPENSEDIESEHSVPACFPLKESTSLGDVEYNAVVSSVADIVTPNVFYCIFIQKAWKIHVPLP